MYRLRMELLERLGVGLAMGCLVVGCGGRAAISEDPGAGGAGAPSGGRGEVFPGQVCPYLASTPEPEEHVKIACGGTCTFAACSSGPCAEPEIVVVPFERTTALALDDRDLYMATNDYHPNGDLVTRISRYQIDQHGGGQISIVAGMVHGLAVHGGRLYWTVEPGKNDATPGYVGSMVLPNGSIERFETTGHPWGIAVGDDTAYWADFDKGVFSTATRNGLFVGTPSFFAGGENVAGVAIEDGSVYWAQRNLDNSIRGKALGEPNRTGTLFACNQLWPGSIVADAQRLYWINQHIDLETGQIMTLKRSGGTPQVLVDGRENLDGTTLAGTTTDLYWVERDHFIMHLQK